MALQLRRKRAKQHAGILKRLEAGESYHAMLNSDSDDLAKFFLSWLK